MNNIYPKIDSSLDAIVSNAVKNNEIILYYQPIFGKDFIYYECLARIKNATYISPVKFLPYLKSSSQYDKFTKIIIEKSFKFFHNKQTHFSINLDFADINNPSTTKFLFDSIIKNKIGNQLIIELLETEMESFNIVQHFIREIKKLGVRVAIDDFGSGYSNYTTLACLSPDIIKIDGSLIKDIALEDSSKIIVKSIVDMAKKLGIKTTAEYVTNEDIYTILKAKGIDYFQGYFIGKPEEELVKI